MFRSISTLLIVSLMILAACNDTQRKEKAENDAALAHEIQAFRDSMQAGLATIDQELGDFEARLHDVNEATRTAMQEILVELRAQRNKLRQDVGNLENVSERVYQRQRASLTQRLYELDADLETARLEAIADRPAFRSAVQTRLLELDRDLENLEHRARAAGATIAAAYQETLDSLSRQREDVNRLYEQAQAASDEAFLGLRSELAEAVARLDTGMRAAADRLEEALEPERLERS